MIRTLTTTTDAATPTSTVNWGKMLTLEPEDSVNTLRAPSFMSDLSNTQPSIKKFEFIDIEAIENRCDRAKTISPRSSRAALKASRHSLSYSLQDWRASNRNEEVFVKLTGSKKPKTSEKARSFMKRLSGGKRNLGDFLLKEEDVRIFRDEVLGGGEFSHVYAGKYKKAKVAVKSVFDPLKYIEEGTLFFECSRHPCICTCFGFLPLEDENYIIMARFDGSVLSAIKNGSRFDFVQLTKMASQICQGVSHLHLHSVGHGDISLRNVLLDTVGAIRCVITDFGLSSKLPAKVQTKAIAVRWAAPEFLKSKRITRKSDVWAIGCTIFELYSQGRRPFPDLSTSEAAAVLDIPGAPPWPCGESILKHERVISMLQCIFTNETERITLEGLIHLLERLQKSSSNVGIIE